MTLLSPASVSLAMGLVPLGLRIKADGGDQQKFDDGMRVMRKKGIQVWPSPDVMEKMGAKDALCKVAKMNIGLEETWMRGFASFRTCLEHQETRCTYRCNFANNYPRGVHCSRCSLDCSLYG